jgi:hypothetical protein
MPIRIDGTDITGATIDGTDVQEITVDGQTVFSAESLPVAYQNLVAWYPFNSSFYGSSNADDVTALFNSGQSGDSTAYDGTVNGASFQSSGGVTDINAGANSGAFDFDGSNDFIQASSYSHPTGDFSVSCWIQADGFTSGDNRFWACESGNLVFCSLDSGTMRFGGVFGGSFNAILGNQPPTDGSTYQHVVATYDTSNGETQLFQDKVQTASTTASSGGGVSSSNLVIGARTNGPDLAFNGRIDDMRFYNKVLSQNEIDTIYTNTEP